jgi:hypothetical protein
LFLGIDLPDLVHRLRAVPPHRRRLGPGRLEACLPKPALQGPLFGHGLPREPLGQLKVDQAAAPARVLPFEGERRLLDSGGKGTGPAALLVPGVQAGFPALTVASPDLPDAAILQVQRGGNGSERLAALVTVNDLLPQGEWQGPWHNLLRIRETAVPKRRRTEGSHRVPATTFRRTP